MLNHHLVHVIASDAHSTDARPPILSEAVNVVSRMLGEAAAQQMVTTIPAHIIHGEPMPMLEPPEKIQRKPFWFF